MNRFHTFISAAALLLTYAASAETFTGPGLRTVGGMVPVDPAKGYRLSGEFRSTAEAAPSITFGLKLYDEKKRLIAHPFVDDVPGTLTTLTAPAEAGSTLLRIADGSKWKKRYNQFTVVVFDARADFSDLPNRKHSLYVNKVYADGKEWVVELRNPLGFSAPAGTSVRQHCEGSYCNVAVNAPRKLTTQWQKFEGEIMGEAAHGSPVDHFWKSARYAEIEFTLNGAKTPVEFRNVALTCDESIGRAPKAKLAGFFDFRNGKSGDAAELKAAEGALTLRSKTGNFVFEQGGLRLADCSQFHIPRPQLPALESDFSVNLWVTINKKQTENILISDRVVNGKYGFRFRLSNGLPSFAYKNKGIEYGIRTIGYAYNDTAAYAPASKAAIKDAANLKIAPGVRAMLTLVFHQGNISIYRDGKLILQENIGEERRKIDASGNDLAVGCEFRKGDFRSQNGANLIIDHLRIYSGVLTDAEVSALYAQEKSQLPPRTAPAAPCTAYREKLMPDCDMEFNKTLPRVQKYLANLPKTKFTAVTDSKLVKKDGILHFFINGKELFPIMSQGCCGHFGVPFTDPKDRFERIMAEPAAAGFEMLGILMNAWRDYGFWRDDRKYDFSAIDLVFDKVLKVAPQAKIQFVIFPEPQDWFMKKHADEMAKYHIQWNSASDVRVFYTGPLSSDFWLGTSCDLIEKLIEYVEHRSYGSHVYDYKLFMAGGGEWHWPGCFTGGVGGYGKTEIEGFRAYLKRKYGNDAALQKAWNDPKVTLATVTTPSPEARLAGDYGYLLDPVKGMPGFDFRSYLCDRTLHCIRTYTAAMKRACKNKKTVTIYQGYSFYFFRSHMPLMLQSGFDIFRYVLELPTIDNIGTPISYENRELGNIGPNNNPFNGSAALHGKLMWQENDLRTHLRPTPEYGCATSAEGTRELLRRGFGMSLTTGTGFWYFPGYQYHDTMTLNTLAELKSIGDKALNCDRRSAAEIALIFDEASVRYASGSLRSNFIGAHSWDTYNMLFRTGAPFDCFLASDLDHPEMRDYKLYIFVNSWYCDKAMRDRIAAKVKKNNAVVLWSYAPGLMSEKGFGADTMREVTGITLKWENRKAEGRQTILPADHILLRETGNQNWFPVQPVVWAEDPGAQTLATFDGKPSLVIKKLPNWTSIFSLMPLTQPMLNNLCDIAGVHRYSRSGDVVTANRGFLFVHTSTAGDKEFTLPGKFDVTELFSGRRIGSGITEFTEKSLPAAVSCLYMLTPAK